MRVCGAGIDAQVLHLLTAERAARHHALHRLLDDTLRVLAAEDLADGAILDAAGIAGMPMKLPLLELVARELHLPRIYDDDVVTAIEMRRVARLVLAAQPISNEI